LHPIDEKIAKMLNRRLTELQSLRLMLFTSSTFPSSSKTSSPICGGLVGSSP
jgi:hypothetical protein